MSSPKRPKREFQPRSHGAIYLIAIVYLGYLMVEIVQSYLAGSDGAPSPGLLAVELGVLGAGIVVLAAMAWRMFKLPAREEQEIENPEDQEAEDWETPGETDDLDWPDEKG